MLNCKSLQNNEKLPFGINNTFDQMIRMKRLEMFMKLVETTPMVIELIAKQNIAIHGEEGSIEILYCRDYKTDPHLVMKSQMKL